MLRSPAEFLVGRDEESRLARRAMRDAESGNAALVLIDGEAGIGKTSFIRSLMQEVRAHGVNVMVGAAHPFDSTRPFGPLISALHLRRDSGDRRRATIGALLDDDGGGIDGAARGATDSRYRVVDEIVDLVESEASAAPVLLALEDLHWADPSTFIAVRTMARELVHVPMLLVVSTRPSPRPAGLDLLLEELREMGASSIELQPLSPPEVDALVRAELGGEPGPGLAALAASAGGNPLWVVELLRSLGADGRFRREAAVVEVASSELPHSLQDLVLRRLRDLPDATLHLLQVASILGDEVGIGDLAAVMRRSASDLVATLDEAFRARLLGERGPAVVFRHQLVHDAIYRSLPEPVRSALHRDAAGALARAGADATQVASHLVLGARPGDLEAVAWLRDAARRSAAHGPAEAVELLRCAERLLPDRHPDADLLAVELLEALLLAGEVAAASAQATAILDGPHRRELDTPVRLRLLESLSLRNLAPELIGHAEAILEEQAGLSDAETSLVLAQAGYGRTFSGDFRGAEATARRALHHAELAGDLAMTVWSLASLSVPVKTQGRYAEALESSQRAVDLAFGAPTDAGRLRHPCFFLGMCLSDADRLDEARAALLRAVDECSVLGSSWILPDALLLAAEQRFLVGEWDDARSELEAGLRVARERGHRILEPQSRASEAIMAIARGDHRAAEAALATVDAVLVGDSPAYGAEMVAFATSMLAEAEGRATAAHRLLSRFWELDERRANRYHHRYLAPPLVRLSLLLDETDIARWVTEGVEAGAALASAVPSVQSVAHRCRGLLDQDPDRMLLAAELARTSGRVLDHLFACEDAAGVLARVGRTAEATTLWSEALTGYEELGAHAWALRVLAMLRRHGVRRSARGPRRRPSAGWESLTPTEVAVSGLVVEGLTNREIARRLHVSPHTVNTHLRHIFRKLEVSTRAALAATTARRDANHANE